MANMACIRQHRVYAATWAALLLLNGLVVWSAHAQTPPRNEAAAGRAGVDQPMFAAPLLEVPPGVKAFDPRLKALWLAALEQSDVETRRQAAEAIGTAYQRGMQELAALDTTASLRHILQKEGLHPVLRLAVVQALARLHDRQAGALFLKIIAENPVNAELAAIIDPELAMWILTSSSYPSEFNSAPALWLARVQDPSQSWAARRSAIVALGTLSVPQAADLLRGIVANAAAPVTERLVAAQALARIKPPGLLALAAQLRGGTSNDRLYAASLLKLQQGAQTEDLLLQLARDTEPAVAAVALHRLIELNPARLDAAVARQLLANADAQVRGLTAQALALQKTPEATALLGPELDDVNPKVRLQTREALLDLAAEENLIAPVRAQVGEMLRGDRWRGLEQVAFLAGALDMKETAPRLVELLRHARSELRVAACVALRRLAVADTLPALFQLAQELTENSLQPAGKVEADWSSGPELTQIFQAFGRQRYAPAEALLRKFIPKSSKLPNQARAAAIWTLGYLHEGRPDMDLARQLEQRLSDVSPMEPEDVQVRQMAAVALGRMKATGSVSILRSFTQSDREMAEVILASRWAITQITGEPSLPLPPPVNRQRGWFLEPIE